jgi:hypothetical protein
MVVQSYYSQRGSESEGKGKGKGKGKKLEHEGIIENKSYCTGASARPSIEGAVARIGAMLLGTKDAPASRGGMEGGLWRRLCGFLDDVAGMSAYLTSRQGMGKPEKSGEEMFGIVSASRP